MSVNKVILIGNVGKDPEVRYFENGGSVANFTLATTERGYTTANGVQVPDRTEWHNITVYRGLAEIASKFIKKGSKIYVEGRIRSRTYNDNNGVERRVTEIWGDNIELLDRRPEGGSNQSYGAPQQPTSQTQPAPQATPQPSTPVMPELPQDDNDDLPF